ncbi:MAG: YARHG domain-containing protein [Eubacteriales bacterium]|nr:YARHG domain-containing protein [Eubacteriales bacterium]
MRRIWIKRIRNTVAGILLAFACAYCLWGNGAFYLLSPAVPGEEARQEGQQYVEMTKSVYMRADREKKAVQFGQGMMMMGAYLSTCKTGTPEDIVYRNYAYCLCKLYERSYLGEVSEFQYIRYWIPFRLNRVWTMRECMDDIKELADISDGTLGMEARADRAFGRRLPTGGKPEPESAESKHNSLESDSDNQESESDHKETVPDSQESQADTSESYGPELERRLMERLPYLEGNPYYPEIQAYREQVQGIRDISGTVEPLLKSDQRYYTEEELAECSETVLYIARNEIYARHGRKFKNPDLHSYFMGQIWYEPTTEPESFDEAVLNNFERQNLLLIQKLEKQQP